MEAPDPNAVPMSTLSEARTSASPFMDIYSQPFQTAPDLPPPPPPDEEDSLRDTNTGMSMAMMGRGGPDRAHLTALAAAIARKRATTDTGASIEDRIAEKKAARTPCTP